MKIIKIIKAEEKDFDQVYEILMHPEVNIYMNFPIMEKPEFHKIWLNFLHRLQVWKDGDVILGLVSIEEGSYRLKHIAHINKLVINQSLGQKGLGTIFFNSIISSLENRGFTRIELEVEADNRKAISFYLKLGFEFEGVRKKLLNREGQFIDNYYMAKML